MVRSETSNSAARASAVSRPRSWSRIRIERRRLARMNFTLAINPDAGCQELSLRLPPSRKPGGLAMTILTTAPAPFALDDPERRDKTAGDGRHDFDVLHGRWRVAHRRLRRRLEGDTQWDEFAGSSGLGTSDDNVIELPSGKYRGATVRVFDPATRLWSVWWM